VWRNVLSCSQNPAKMGIGSKLLKKATKAITLTRKASLASKESIDAAKEKLKSVSTADIPQDIAGDHNNSLVNGTSKAG